MTVSPVDDMRALVWEGFSAYQSPTSEFRRLIRCTRYIANDKFSDAVIISGKRKYPVHRVILSTHSEFFDRHFRNHKVKYCLGVRSIYLYSTGP
jgi:hypothetical protein